MKSEKSIDGLAAELALSERRRRETQRLSGVGFWELNHKNNTLYWSEETFAIYGLEANVLEPDYEIFASLIHDDDRKLVDRAYRSSVESGTEYDIRYRIKAGDAMKWIEARGVTYYDEEGNPERSVGTARDISEIVDAQEAAEHLAYHDALTGLPNRALLSDRLTAASRLADRDGSRIAILFIDLDNFKEVNDGFGHDVGDEVLVAVAKQMTINARAGDTFARIGGDEFVGVLLNVDEDAVDHVVRRVKDSIEQTYETRAGSFEITASIGVTVYPFDSDEPDALLRHADHAMYQAKESGNSRIHYFDTERHHTNLSRHQLMRDIENALRGNEFELHFQPKVSLRDGRLAGAEALLRWFPPGGPVPPSEVINAIRGTPLEWALDRWVIQTVLRAARTFREHELTGPFSLNINPSTIEDRDFPEQLGALLSEAEVLGEILEIEILEISSIKDFQRTKEILQSCKALGVCFSLDDFGTGYSSLTYFHSLPVDKLKIDQRFVRSLLSDNQSLALIKSILAIAHANDYPVVAEGIECFAVARELIALGCDFGQGFGLAKPMPIRDYVTWAKRWDPGSFIREIEAQTKLVLPGE